MISFLAKCLFGLYIISENAVEPICVSIDEYQTSDHEFNIYLFGDYHIGHPEVAQREQFEFLSAAQEKNAFVITEDLAIYDGNDPQTKYFIDEYFNNPVPENEIWFNSALRKLTRRCSEKKIPFFNAECRHKIKRADKVGNKMLQESSLDDLSVDISQMVLKLRNKDDDWLGDYYRDNISINKKTGAKKLKKIKNFENIAVDIRILQALHDLMDGSNMLVQGSKREEWLLKLPSLDERKKNIFVFAGKNHLNRIIPVLEGYLGCSRNLADQRQKFSRNRYIENEFNYDDSRYLTAIGIWQEFDQILAKKFVDKYKINITKFPDFKKSSKSKQSLLEEVGDAQAHKPCQ